MPVSLHYVPTPVFIAFIGVLGLIFGSFVTALSFRLPRGISTAKGRSVCPSCGTTLAAGDLIPVFSWLRSRGRCRTCAALIPWRYPAIEALTAALFVSAAIWERDPARLLLLLATAPVLMTLAVVDIEHFRLPNILLVWLLPLAVGICYVDVADLRQAVAAGVAVFALALALDAFGRRFLGQGLGMGDAKLMGIMAVALPLEPLLLTLAAAGGLGVLIGWGLRRRSKQPASAPFGPALVSAYWIALLIS